MKDVSCVGDGFSRETIKDVRKTLIKSFGILCLCFSVALTIIIIGVILAVIVGFAISSPAENKEAMKDLIGILKGEDGIIFVVLFYILVCFGFCSATRFAFGFGRRLKVADVNTIELDTLITEIADKIKSYAFSASISCAVGFAIYFIVNVIGIVAMVHYDIDFQLKWIILTLVINLSITLCGTWVFAGIPKAYQFVREFFWISGEYDEYIPAVLWMISIFVFFVMLFVFNVKIIISLIRDIRKMKKICSQFKED